jgi:hypothetical protein
MDSKVYPLFNQPGVLAGRTSDGEVIVRGILFFGDMGDDMVAYHPDRSDTLYPLQREDLTVEQNTGRIRFSVNNTNYMVREFRESDGRYVSEYRTSLPTEALEKLMFSQMEGNRVANTGTAPTMDISPERLAAYAMDDSAYVLGLVYSVAGDRWVRIDDDWILMSPDDDTFSDMVVINIDPVKADDFIKLYDRNFVTVTTASKYEDTPPEFLPVSELPEDEAQPTETTPTETA